MDIEEQYDKIYRYCCHRTRSPAAAEDITQETFLRWLAAGPDRDDGHALRWLYTVARNLCADEHRRRKPEPLPEELPAPGGEGDALDRIGLRAALGELTEEERELILLRYVNQEPVNVIAGALGMSRFAVYRRTAAILEKLRRRLKED